MDIKQHALEKLSYYDKKVKQLQNDIDELRVKLAFESPDTMMRLISDEKYRIETALMLSHSRVEAAKLLNMNHRTFYRKLNQYSLK